MKPTSFKLGAMALAATAAHAADLPLWSAATGPDLTLYTLAFSDEFDTTAGIGNGRGATAPPTPWWDFRHPVMFTSETYVSATDARAYLASGGVLTMSTYVNAQGVNTEADIETVRSFGPDFYAEVRMRGPQVNGVHAGVWFLSVDNGRSDATGGHAELDLVEQYGPSDQGDHCASHVWPGARKGISHQSVSAWTVRPEGKAVAWHTYGLLATERTFTIYRDGAPVQRIARLPSQHVPMYLLLSLFGNGPHAPPATMQVDYVRLWTAP